MKSQKQPFNLLGMAGLGPRKKTPEQKKYSSFNRRMFAATIDSIIMMFTVAPVVGYMYGVYYGPLPMDVAAVQKEVQGLEPQEANRIFLQRIIDSGAVDYWLHNVSVQAFAYMMLAGMCWRVWSATPGKMIMRMKVVDAKTEKPLTDNQILLRLIGYVFSSAGFMIGFIWIGIDKRKQAWHDKLAGSVVINIPWKKETIPGSEAADPLDSQAPSGGV